MKRGSRSPTALWFLIAAASVCVAAIMLAVVFWPSSADSPPPPERAADRPAAVERPRVATAPALAQIGERAPDPPGDAVGEEPADEHVVAEGNRLADALRELFSNQPRDEAWASTRESFVQALFDSEVPGSLLEIECRSNLCRLVIRAEPEVLMSAVPLLQHTGGDHAPSPDPVDGNLEMWLSRTGARIGDPEDPSRLALSAPK